MAVGTAAAGQRGNTGYRVARWRMVAGLTQEQLAMRLGVTREYVSMIENGHRPVVRRSLLLDLANALRVGVNDLTGQPPVPATAAERAAYMVAPAVRRALDGSEDGTSSGIPSERLVAMADRVHVARMAGDWDELGAVLPPLLGEVQVLADQGRELASYVKTCVGASFAVRLLGFVDLGRLLADRAAMAAAACGHPEFQAAAEFARAAVILEAGNRQQAFRIAETAAAAYRSAADLDGVRGWLVMLHLLSAMSVASLGRTDDVTTHLGEAADLVRRVESDPWCMEVKPANVDLWRVGVALDDGDPESAPDLARKVDKVALRTPDRMARLHFDTARGLFARGDYARCTWSLLEADRIYPLMLWTRPQALEIVGQMARDARPKGGSSELVTLCTRVGVDPAAPPDPPA